MSRSLGMLVGSVLLGLPIGWLCFSPPRAGSTTSSSFLPPTAYTGAPGESFCGECHLSTGGGGTFAIGGVPESYTPGQTYTITVTLNQALQRRWGFELTVQRLDTGAMGGTLIDVSDHTVIQTIAGRQYISHTSNGQSIGTPTPDPRDGTFWSTAANGPATWTFDWTAPAAGTGAVRFYAAGNAANGNSNNGGGDYAYLTTADSNESVVTAVTGTTWGKIKKLYIDRALP